MWIPWLQFLVCALLIWRAGTRLSRYGDVIAEKTGMAGGWVGLVLLATVTSLPELVTATSAVTIASAPDLALGDLLGACVMNLMIVAVIDVIDPSDGIFHRIGQGHVVSAAFGVLLLGITAIGLVAANNGIALALGHVSLISPAILVLYAVAIRTIYHFERRQVAELIERGAERYADVSLREAVIGYVLAGLVVVAVGIALPFVGERIAETMGWEQTFVGTLFLALATTVPEIVVTVSAARMGAADMAIGNLLGSNLFDIAILAIADLAMVSGPITAAASPLHAISAASAMMMSGVTIIACVYRPRRAVFQRAAWASVLLLSLYALNAYVLFRGAN